MGEKCGHIVQSERSLSSSVRIGAENKCEIEGLKVGKRKGSFVHKQKRQKRYMCEEIFYFYIYHMTLFILKELFSARQ